MIVWLPIPLGSNRPWAWVIVEIASFSMLLLIILYRPKLFFRQIERHSFALTLFLLFIILQILLVVPFPSELIQTIRPERLFGLEIYRSKSLPLSYDVFQSKVTILKSIAYFGLFLTSLCLLKSAKRIKLVLLTLSLSGVLQASYGAFEVLLNSEKSLIFEYKITHIATGSFVYKNHFANYLMLTLSAALGYLIASSSFTKTESTSRRELLKYWTNFLLSKKALVRIGIVIMVIALIMSRSRMGNTAFFVSMTITLFLGLLLFKRKSKSYVYLFISLIAVDIILVSSVFGLSEVTERIEQTSLQKETRDEVLEDTASIIPKYKTLGSGGGTFYTIYPMVQSEKIQHFYDHAHNEYIQFSVEFGWLATTLISIFVLICATTALISLRKRERPAYLGAAFCCVMATIGMLMHASVDFPLQAPANAATFLILLSLGVKSKKINH